MILVTGADGYIGRETVAVLAKRGKVVRAGVRGAGNPVPMATQTVAVGDLAKDVDWTDVLTDVSCVVHCAARAHVMREEASDPLSAFRAVNRDATLALAKAAIAAGLKRMVFVSSAGVNGGETKGVPFRADDVPHPHSPYAIAKYEAELGLEELVHGTDLELVIIRPPLVLGLEPKGNLGTLVRVIVQGVPLPLGMVRHNRRDLVSLSVLTDFIALCVDHPAAPGGVLLVSDGKVRSTREIVETLAADVGRTPRFLPVPPSLLGITLRVLGRGNLAAQLLGDFELDLSDTVRRLNWQPSLGVPT